MDISEGTVFRSINTNKSKHFLKIEGAVDPQKNICIYNGYKGHLSFQEKKNLHTTATLVYVQLLVCLWFHRCL